MWTVAIVAMLGVVIPFVAVAQQRAQVPKVGVLWGGETAFAMPYVEAARRAMSDLGYVEGKDFVTELRFGERKPGAVDTLAADLVERKVDVIIAAGDPAIRAARRATATIPIVMVAAGDPVRSGLVASLARPGGNVTGMTFLTSELAAKRLELLKEAVPTASRVAVLWNPENPGGPPDLQAIQSAAESRKIALQSFEVRKVGDFAQAFKQMTDARMQAVIVLTDPVTANVAGKVVADFALKYGLPTICDLSEFTRSGALLSYGPSLRSMAERSVLFVAKILKGVKAADLPIEQPTNFELVVNLKTAHALGVTVPSSLLTRADDVIR
ncbi:MAG TPA: ABC transporter substrate-binding protein [Gaiellales bacterium]|nr:ABC transporter substrate-binding protein [Gaiellales bacterium]